MEEFKNYLKQDNKILVICSHPLDLDSIGSGLLIKHYLESLGKKATVVFPRKLLKEERQEFEYLPGFADLIDQDTREYFLKPEYDAVVFLDGGSITQFFDDEKGRDNPPNIENFPKRVHIDHHIKQNTLGTLTFHDQTCSSTAEVILKYVIPREDMTSQMATLAYGAFVGDTGNFKWAFTPQTLKYAAMLLERGATPQLILEKVYFSKTPKYFNVFKYVITNLEFYPNIGTVILPLELNKLIKDKITEAQLNLIKDIFNSEVARSIEGFPRGILLKEEHPGEIRVSFRGSTLYNKIDMNEVFRKTGGSGGGHFNACGYAWAGTFDGVKRKIIKEIKSALE